MQRIRQALRKAEQFAPRRTMDLEFAYSSRWIDEDRYQSRGKGWM
ncbi:hypothetical protein [Metabacillus malikii]|uniref:Uncharacterized protein n=1 Tax=Metabacillus malikii TaxID=1504265 RepID=A0ABT9ZEB6_9BACI|nr:hypothetical protein [Metabacillus malikii]MDQ0230607.1 hypothetical protein [Metabacillus malikii]